MTSFDIESMLNDEDIDMQSGFKISPERYVHYSIIFAQKTLMISIFRGNFNDGLAAYRILMEQIHSFARAAGWITESLEKELASLKEIYKEMPTDTPREKQIKDSNYSTAKMEKLLSVIFKRSPITKPLYLGQGEKRMKSNSDNGEEDEDN